MIARLCDVVVVGSGNAGMAAALAARDAGAEVVILEKSPPEWAGGNSHFSAGAFRVAFESLSDLRSLLEIDDEAADRIEMAGYPVDSFVDDLRRVTRGRTDPTLARLVAEDSLDAARWLAGKGVRWELLLDRQSFAVGNRRRFWGNLVLGTVGGGAGLVESEFAAVDRAGVEIRYESAVVGMDVSGDSVALEVDGPRGRRTVAAGAVVMASGGFEADAKRRAEHLGPGWDLALVRGTPFNTGDGLFSLIEAGAATHGHWSGSHAIAWDAAAPRHGDRVLTNRYSRQGYPYGIVVNRLGRRFVDEGADFRNYTYARYGAEIMRQPQARAFQIFDQQSLPLVSAVDYATADSTRSDAQTIERLAEEIGVDPEQLAATVSAYNAGVSSDAFDPTVKDRKHTRGVSPPKSNWALPIDHPPFVAFEVTCGITFTFGGVRIDPDGAVLRPSGAPLSRTFASGELVGGLFYHNYPGGSGLTAGVVFGRRAGAAAARAAGRAPI